MLARRKRRYEKLKMQNVEQGMVNSEFRSGMGIAREYRYRYGQQQTIMK